MARKITEPNKPVLISYIRFSSETQLKGDSLRRQVEASKKYADEHGLEVDERYALKDLGKSAFHAEHKRCGALGVFLKLVEEGQIPKGSVLLLESFDRLSREKISVAVDTFRDITKRGIKIVTLLDGREYTEDADYTDWIILITMLSRAHEESETKSKRLKSAWEQKRKNIRTKPLTAKAPAWLSLDKKTGRFKKLPKRCQLVERAFTLYLEGYGADRIARIFNTEGIPAFQGKNGFHKSYIQKILNNYAVIGTFQPYIRDGRKRVPIGEPIPDYYPRIVSDGVFHETQERLRSNARGGGRTGKVNNLFAHIAKCGICHAPMQFIDKGKGDQQYLICDNARRARGCHETSFRYPEFEEAFLRSCSELDVRSILPSNHGDLDNETAQLVSKIDNAKGESSAITMQRKNLISMLKTSDDDLFVKEIKEELKHVIDEGRKLQKGIDEDTATLEKIRSSEKRAEEHLRDITELIKILKDTKDDDLTIIRQKLRTAIRQIVRRIDVFPNGLRGRILSMIRLQPEYIDLRETALGCEPDEYNEYLKATTGREKKLAAVWFNAGGFRELYYDGDNGFSVNIQGESSQDIWQKMQKLPHNTGDKS